MENTKNSESMKRIVTLIQGLTYKIKSLEENKTEFLAIKNKFESLDERVEHLEKIVLKLNGHSNNEQGTTSKGNSETNNSLIQEFIEEQELAEKSYNTHEFIDTDMNIDDDDDRDDERNSLWESSGNPDSNNSNDFDDENQSHMFEEKHNYTRTQKTLVGLDINLNKIASNEITLKAKQKPKKGVSKVKKHMSNSSKIKAPSSDGILECTQCTKTFENREHAKQHLEVHTGIKPYQCSLCDYESYKVYNVIVNHFTNRHGRRADKEEIVTNESDRQRLNDMVAIELNRMLDSAKKKL